MCHTMCNCCQCLLLLALACSQLSLLVHAPFVAHAARTWVFSDPRSTAVFETFSEIVFLTALPGEGYAIHTSCYTICFQVPMNLWYPTAMHLAHAAYLLSLGSFMTCITSCRSHISQFQSAGGTKIKRVSTFKKIPPPSTFVVIILRTPQFHVTMVSI